MRFLYTKGFAIFFLCIVIVCFIVFLQIKGLVDPVKNLFLQAPRPVISVIRNFSEPAKIFFATAYRLKTIAKENGQLHNQVLQLQQDLSLLEQEKVENQTLRTELGFVKENPAGYIPCTVLSQNPFELNDSFVL